MRRITLRSLWEHKRRLISTVVAITLGVAFMSGTFVFTDTLDKVFDDLFADANEEIDAQVQGPVDFEDPFTGDIRARIDESVRDEVAALDGVRSAAPYIVTLGGGANNIVLGADGEAIGMTGPPTLLEAWIDDPDLNPYDIDEGRGPEADDEIALNVRAVEDGELSVGDTVAVLTQFGRSEYTLVGTLSFGGEDALGAAVSANFTLAEAQRLAGVDGQVDNIIAAAQDGLSQQDLVDRIRARVSEDLDVLTGVEAAEQLADSVQSGFSFIRTILSAFGAIALVVGAFIISNTFAILVAQRTRELALLRAVGASRPQVLGSVLLEAVVVGLVAAAIGLGVGVLLALLVAGLLSGGGLELPDLVVSFGTIQFALLAGVIITVLSAIVPAIRATRVPPLAALREVAVDRSSTSKARAAIGVLFLVLAALVLVGAYRADIADNVAASVGLGGLLLLVGAIVIGPVVADPTVRVLGGLLPRLRGVTGRLAVENAARSPKRTSATAASLIVAVGLIGFITVFAASAKASITDQVSSGLISDFVVQPDATFFSGAFTGLPGGLADTIESEVPDVEFVTGVGFAPGEVTYPNGDTASTFLSIVEPEQLSQVISPKMTQGSLDDLRPGGVIADQVRAERNNLGIGDSINLRVPQGASIDLEIVALSNDPNVLGYWTFSREDFAAIGTQDVSQYLYLDVADGADLAAVQSEIEDAIADAPGIAVLDRDEFRDSLVNQITGILNLIYGLLGLSIIIAGIGIANTLSLSIHERTREIGLLRAVGMHRAQLKSAIRWEAALIAVLGTLVGVGVGVVLSRCLVQALRSEGLGVFQVPVGSLITIVLLAAILGVAFSLRPARRAARLDVLDAIAHE